MIRVDSHFHPNFHFALPEALRRRKARKIWRAFERFALDVVFVSEHCFKKPARSFSQLQRCRPHGARTLLIPAVEALSREGMEVIVFSRDTYVYTQKDILTPYALPMDTLLKRIRNDHRLFAVLPHPFTLSDTSMIHHCSPAQVKAAECTIHCVEKYNASLRPVERWFFALGLHHLFPSVGQRLRSTADMPSAMIPEGVLAFGGSDAHHIREIGTCLHIHAERPSDDDALFSLVTCDTHRRTMAWRTQRMSFLLYALSNGLSTLAESLKKRLRLYRVDTTFFDPSMQIGGMV